MKLFHRSRSAFTLIEVLMAATITVILVVAITSIFLSLTNSVSQSDQRLDAFREARAAISLIQRDLSGLVSAQNAAPYLALCDRSRGYPGAVSGTSGGEELYFLGARQKSTAGAGGPTPTPTTEGDVAAIGYYCAWDAGKAAFELRRSYRKPVDTFSALKTSFDATIGQTPRLAKLDDVYIPDRSKDDVLASYVWDLRIRALGADGNAVQFNGQPYPLVWDDKNFQPRPSVPYVLEISFKAISPVAAQRLKALGMTAEDWMKVRSTTQEPESKYVRFLKPLEYEFRTVVSVKPQ